MVYISRKNIYVCNSDTTARYVQSPNVKVSGVDVRIVVRSNRKQSHIYMCAHITYVYSKK